MKDENQLPEITCSFEDVVSAWFVCAAVIFGLLGISLIQEMPKAFNTDGWISDKIPAQSIKVIADELDLGDLRFGLIESQETGNPDYHPYAAVTKSYTESESKEARPSMRLRNPQVHGGYVKAHAPVFR